MQLVKRIWAGVKGVGAWMLVHRKLLAALIALKIAVTLPGLYYFGDALPLPNTVKTFPARMVKIVSAKAALRARERGLEMLRLQNEARENDPSLCVVIVSPFLAEEELETLFLFLGEMKIMAYFFTEEARLNLEAGNGSFEKSFEQAIDILQERISLQNTFIERAQTRAANEIKALMENAVKKSQSGKRRPI